MLYRLTYMLGLKLINLVAFFKWEHVDVINFLLTLCKGFIVKQGTLDFFGLSGRLRCFIQFKNKVLYHPKKTK